MLNILKNQSNTYSGIINSQVKANELILKCRIYTNNAARNVRDMALDPSDPNNADLQARAESALETLSESMKELKAVYPLSDDKVRYFRRHQFRQTGGRHPSDQKQLYTQVKWHD